MWKRVRNAEQRKENKRYKRMELWVLYARESQPSEQRLMMWPVAVGYCCHLTLFIDSVSFGDPIPRQFC